MINVIKIHFYADRKDIRNFGIIIAVGITLLSYLIFPITFGVERKLVPGIVALVFFILSFSFIPLLRLLYVPWMLFGSILNYINTRIILGVIYFVMFAPLSCFFKVTGRDFLKLKIDRNCKSYRTEPDNLELSDKPF